MSSRTDSGRIGIIGGGLGGLAAACTLAARGHKVVLFDANAWAGGKAAEVGGSLGIDVLGLDPTFPIKYMVYFLLVVAVGGAGTIKGPLLAAVVLGIFDVAGKYYVPEVGAFVIYALMVVLLLLFPNGLLGRRT